MPMAKSDLLPALALSTAPSLLERLRAWLDVGPPSVPLDHAVAALLVHAATLRGPMSAARRQHIEALLRGRMGGDDEATAWLIGAAQREDDHAADLHQFARVVNRHLAQGDRVAVFEMAARVAFADAAGADEEGFLRLLGGLLGISDHDRGIVQHRARLSHDPLSQTPTPTSSKEL